jgi:L-threonylcarbamoyladenylate synthase
MLDAHYSPKKKLLLGDIAELLQIHRGNTPVLLRFSSLISDYPEALQLVLSPQASVAEAAIHLFEYLRLADQFPSPLILAELVPDSGLGRAINDRLKRASFH